MNIKINFSFFVFCLFSLCFFQNCESEKRTTEQVIEHNSTIAKTNIRFANKKDGYQEHPSAKRLSTNKTEVTSQHFQMEGPAWENENVAFRNYFDARNGMDIFGKRKTEMVLDSVGIDENYHELQDWGMDILKVGNSLGAGGIGLIIRDSLYRIGENGTGEYELISEGKNKSSLRFTFDNLGIKNRKYRVIHEIEIKSGTHFYKSKVSVEGLQGDETIVSGVVAHLDAVTNGKTSTHSILATHGAQALEGGNLGMALATPTAQFVKVSKAADYKGNIDQTHLLEMKPEKSTVEFYFFAGWELQDAQFKTAKNFDALVKKELNQE